MRVVGLWYIEPEWHCVKSSQEVTAVSRDKIKAISREGQGNHEKGYRQNTQWPSIRSLTLRHCTFAPRNQSFSRSASPSSASLSSSSELYSGVSSAVSTTCPRIPVSQTRPSTSMAITTSKPAIEHRNCQFSLAPCQSPDRSSQCLVNH